MTIPGARSAREGVVSRNPGPESADSALDHNRDLSGLLRTVYIYRSSYPIPIRRLPIEDDGSHLLSPMASIELPRRAHTAIPGNEQAAQAHEEPLPAERRWQDPASTPVQSRAERACSSFLAHLALKHLPFSPLLAPHCDVRDYAGQ